jgi:hypothetical protein
MTTEMTVDKLIGAYLKLRNKKDSIEAAAKQQTDNIAKLMTKLEQQLLQQCDAQGVDSFKTEHGTAFIKETDYASVEDWDAVIAFIEKNKAYEFLTKKVNKIPVREFIEEHNGEMPPGMSYGVRRGLTVRIPSTSKTKK